jgi:hypothetical protein
VGFVGAVWPLILLGPFKVSEESGVNLGSGDLSEIESPWAQSGPLQIVVSLKTSILSVAISCIPEGHPTVVAVVYPAQRLTEKTREKGSRSNPVSVSGQNSVRVLSCAGSERASSMDHAGSRWLPSMSRTIRVPWNSSVGGAGAGVSLYLSLL